MDPANIAVATSIATIGAWWTVTRGLIGIHEVEQAAECITRSGKLIDQTALSQANLSAEQLLEHVRDQGLSLTTVPDLVMKVKIRRSYTLSGLCSAVGLALIPVLIEGAITTGYQKTDARATAQLVACLSIVVTGLCAFGILHLAITLNGWEAIKDVARLRKR